MASAAVRAKDFAGAKSAALAVFHLANQMNNGNSRASAFSSISGLGAQVGITNELVAVIDALPEGSARQDVVKGLVKEYAELGQDAKIATMVAKITDLSARKGVLSEIIATRIAAGNWAGAVTLANDPGVSGRLYAEIAKKQLDAGMIREAAALEPKFGAASGESDSYFSTLASLHARNAEFDAAAQAALRLAEVTNQISNLFSVASFAYSIGGPSAAKPAIERALGRFVDLKSPLERSNACRSIMYYLQHNSYFTDSFPKPERPAGPAGPAGDAVVGLACVAEALAIPTQSDRLSPLSSSVSSYYDYVVTRPVFGPSVAPTRAAISRLLAEASGLTSGSRDSNVSSAAMGLAREGAIESALDIAGFPGNARSYGTAAAAVQWLTEAGDTASAQRIVNQLLDHIATITDASAKDSANITAINLLVMIGDFERALKAGSDIVAAGSRDGPFVSIANAANARGRFDVALNALERARLADKEAGRTYYLSSYVTIAAQAGDKRPEAFIDEMEAQKGPYTATNTIYARDAVVRGLLKWKQRDRAAALIAAQDAAIAHLDAPARWSQAAAFANILAQLGDAPRLDRLVADAPLAVNKVALLQQAARGYIDAEKPDPARVALEKSVSLIGTIPGAADRSSYLQGAASIYVLLKQPDIAATLLGQSIEVLHVSRPDLAGWISYTIAVNQEAVDPDQAERRASAITDAHWRARAIDALATSRFARDRIPSALALLRSAAPSEMLDLTLLKFTRSAAAKGDIETARALIGRIAHPGLRDQGRRQLVLITGRLGKVETALAETGTIDNTTTRAYTLIDLGAFLARQTNDKQASYFAQLGCFVAARLADQVGDALVKTDLLADAAHGIAAMEPEAAVPALARARAAAAALPAGRAHDYAMIWVNGASDTAKRVQPSEDEASQWRYSAGYLADNQKFSDPDGFVQAMAAKNPTDRANGFAYAAVEFADQIQQAHDKEKEYASKRKQAQ